MRLRIVVIAISLFTVLICFFIIGFLKGKDLRRLPFYEIPTLDIPIFGTDSIYSLKQNSEINKTVVFFFSPDCSFCEEEIKGIIESDYSSESTRWIFISNPMSSDDIPLFLQRVPLYTIKGSIILVDSSLRYHSLFGVAAPPSLFIYDKKGKLEFYYGQSVKPQELIKLLEK